MKIAKDSQRVLQQENSFFEQRLVDAEAQNSNDRVVVEAALARLEGCVDAGIRMLKSFFTKQELRPERARGSLPL